MKGLAPSALGVAAPGLVPGGCESGPGAPIDTDQDGALTLATLPRTPLQQLMDRGPR